MPLSHDQLGALKRISAPTLSNAIELAKIRPRDQGFMSPEIRCLFPDLGAMVGYAVTARFRAAQPLAQPASRIEFWKSSLAIPEPRVLVLEDLDRPVGVGAFVGEIMATIHQRLGFVGAISNGHFRDFDEVRALGFHFFAAGACVSHAYVDLVDFGTPVTVGGLVVRPGDLLHGDQHGVLSIPTEIAASLPGAVAQVLEREKRILDVCGSPRFDIGDLKEFFD